MLSHAALSHRVTFRICALSVLAAILFIAGCTTSSSTPPPPPQFAVTTTSSQLTATISTAFSLSLTAANGTGTITWSYTGTLPNGMTLNSSGMLSGTPTQSGAFTVMVTATDSASHTATASLTITVDQAPTITSANSFTFTVGGTSNSFTVTGTGFPTPTFSETGALPQGVTLSSAGVLGGTPAAGTGGMYSINITAQNGTIPNATQAFTLTVDEAPKITSATSATFVVNTAGTFTVTAMGFPAPTFTETGALPLGVTLSAAGVLSGTATATGTFSITFTAHNGIGTDATQMFTLTIGSAPAITSANSTTFTVGTPGSFTVMATGFPAPTLMEAGGLPMGVTFNATTGVLSGTAAATTGKVYTIILTASNSISNIQQSFTLTVDEAPTFTSLASYTFAVGSPGTFTVTAAGFPAPTLALTTATPPVWLSFNAATGKLSGTPPSGADAGSPYALTFTATNGVSPNATQSFTLNVVVQLKPTITSAPSAAFTVSTHGSFTVTTTGAPAPALTAAGRLPTGSPNVTFIDNHDGTATISGIPGSGTAGSYSLTITAHNGVGTDAMQSFTLSIVPPPVASGLLASPSTITAGGMSTLTPTFSAGTGVISNNVDSTTITASNGVGVTVSPTVTTTYTLTVTNAAGATATKQVTVTVVAAPVIASFTASPTTIASGSSSTLTPVFSNGTGVITNSVDSTSISATTNVGVSVSPATTTTYTLTVTNSLGGKVQSTATVTVNSPAMITSAPNTTFIVNTAGSFTVTATGSPAPTLSESGMLPTGVTFTPPVLSGTTATTGTFPITFTAHNGIGADATQNFTLTVNTAPAMVSTNVGLLPPLFAGQTFPPGTSPSLTITITVTNDAPGDVLTATLTTDANTTFNCTIATCGSVGSVVGTSGTGYTVQYTPPASTASFIQTVPTLVVNSSLSGAIGSTDFIEVDPAGILVQVGGVGRGGTVYVGANPPDTRNLDVFVYNDTVHNGVRVTFPPLSGGGYRCDNLNPNQCGTLGTQSVTTGNVDPITGVQYDVFTIPYTPPASLPAPPYDTPRVEAISVTDNTRSGVAGLLLASDPTAPTIPPLFIFGNSKFKTAVLGTPTTLHARILNDTGTSQTINWTLMANGASCSPGCGTLTNEMHTVTATGGGPRVDSSITYTPPATLPVGAASTTYTVTATAPDFPGVTDSFSFNIFDPTCGSGHESVLNGSYAFLLRGAGRGAGHAALIGSFNADGAGHITGGVYDINTQGGGTYLNVQLLNTPQGQLPASSYTVGADNRVCFTLTDSTGGLSNFRASVGTLVSNVATQGRIILFTDVVGYSLRLSGVIYKQDPASFNAAAFNGTYAFGVEGVENNGARLADAGLVTANGAGILSNLSADLNGAGAVATQTGSGTYSLATNSPGGRGTATTTTTVTPPGSTSTGHSVFYMISASHALLMTTDLSSTGQPIQSGEVRKQTGAPFAPTALDGKNYVFVVEGVHTSDGGNDTVIGQTTVTTNGHATVTFDENKSGVEQPTQSTPLAAFTIAPNGRTTLSGVGNNPPILYLIDSTSAFIVGTGGSGESGYVVQQVGAPFSNASFPAGQYFFGADAPTTAAHYQSGTINLSGGQVTGIGDVTSSNGLRTDSISPAKGGTYCFSSSCSPPISTPVGRGVIGAGQANPGIAYAISSSEIIFMSTGTGTDIDIFVIQK